MIPPETPAGAPIRQAVFHHQPNRHGHDPLGVVPAGWGQIGRVGVEILGTGRAIVLGIGEFELMWASRDQIAQVIQLACEDLVPRCGLAALRTRLHRIIARLFEPFGFGQVFESGEGDIRHIFTGSQFGRGGRRGCFHQGRVYSQMHSFAPASQ